MAFLHDTHTVRPSFVEGISKALRAVAASFDLAVSSQMRIRQIEKLNALSDAELAAKGLHRDDITRYVFRDILHV